MTNCVFNSVLTAAAAAAAGWGGGGGRGSVRFGFLDFEGPASVVAFRFLVSIDSYGMFRWNQLSIQVLCSQLTCHLLCM